MTGSADFFTQASNFISAISGKVDPRTGLYGINVNLGQIVANNLLGPSVPLILNYSPLSKANMGFGTGFSFSLSTYNTETRRLSLSSGEQYSVQGNDQVLQQILKNFTFKYQYDDYSREKTYTIRYKSGIVEVLGGAGVVKVPLRVFTPGGHSITLSWNYDNGEPRLQNIQDDVGSELLKITYPSYTTGGSENTTIHVLPESEDDSYNVVLSFEHENLVSLCSDALGDKDTSLTWSIGYLQTHNWGWWANSLTVPGGMIENATYRDDETAHGFPSSSGITAKLPYVTILTINGQGMTELETRYSYTAHNFLGYGSQVNWQSQTDNLYNYTGSTNYKYASTETQTSGQTTTETTREYNNYHLLETQTVSTNSCTTTTETEYYLIYGVTADQQPAIAQFPKYVTTTWSNSTTTPISSYSEVTYTEFDDMGNPTLKIQNYDRSLETQAEEKISGQKGEITQWTYYPAAGEKSQDGKTYLCPPDPNGFKRFIRQVTTTPACPDNDYAIPAQRIEYRYAAYTPDANSVITSTVLKSEELHYSVIPMQGTNGSESTRLLAKNTSTYASDVSELGRLIETVNYHYPDEVNEIATTQTIQTISNKVAGTITMTQTTNTHDKIELEETQCCNLWNRQVLMESDALGVKDMAVYDKLGRVTSVTSAVGTEYENTRVFAYSINSKNTLPFQITTTDMLNNQFRTDLNSEGKLMAAHVKLSGMNSWAQMGTRTYDNLGRTVTETSYDFNQLTIVSKPDVTVVKTFAYDDWGQNHLVTESLTEDILHWKIIDPTKLTVTEFSENGQKTVKSSHTVTTYNSYHQPIKTELYSANKTPGKDAPDSTVTQHYDGLNQLRRHTDELGRSTNYDYDDFGRVTVTTLPALNDTTIGAQVRRYYDTQSPEEWCSAISVIDEGGTIAQEVILGVQVFDGLGRITRRTNGGSIASWNHDGILQLPVTVGRIWTAEYDKSSGSLLKPISIHALKMQNGDEQQALTINNSYSAELGGKILSENANQFTKQFSYDGKTGKLQMAKVFSTPSVDSYSIKNTYNMQGRQETELLAYQYAGVASGQLTSKSSSYSVGGNRISSVDVSGVAQTVGRDIYGRLLSLDDSHIHVSITDYQPNKDEETFESGYDGLGRQRTWWVRNNSANCVLKTVLDWDSFGREITRTIISYDSNDEKVHTWIQTQTWNLNHQIQSKIQMLDDEQIKQEYYHYDARNRLVKYTVTPTTSSGLPINEQGNAFYSADYVYDVYSNITSVTQTEVGGDKYCVSYQFGDPKNNNDPCQLLKITHSRNQQDIGSQTLSYDPCSGALLDDDQGRTFTYNNNVFYGHLESTTYNGITSEYSYDAFNRMSRQDNNLFCYQGDMLVNQVDATKNSSGVRLIASSSGNLAQVFTGNVSGVLLSGSDANGSVLFTDNATIQTAQSFGPYGEKGK